MRVGRMNIDNKSMLIGVLVAMVGLSAKPTQGFFAQILSTVSGFVGSIFGGGKK